jgi:hypothetical protein
VGTALSLAVLGAVALVAQWPGSEAARAAGAE